MENNTPNNIKIYIQAISELEKVQHNSLKPDQYSKLIDRLFQKINIELDNAKGKKFVMDLALLPKSTNWTVDQWAYYFDNLGVTFIDSSAKRQNEYVIPEECRLKGFRHDSFKYIIPQVKEVPSKYWGLYSENKTVRWNEE